MSNIQINWDEVRKEFEDDMANKLASLPGHHGFNGDKFVLRSIISHELPETTKKTVFTELIDKLINDKEIHLPEIKKGYLEPTLVEENSKLLKHKSQIPELRRSAGIWVKTNLSEDKLQQLWKEHKTWLPRRYTIYQDKNTLFEIIARDTLVRYYLLRYQSKTSV